MLGSYMSMKAKNGQINNKKRGDKQKMQES